MERVEKHSEANIVLGKKHGVIRPYPKTACCDDMLDFLKDAASGGDFSIDFRHKQQLARGSKTIKKPFNCCPWCGSSIVYFYDDKFIIE